MEGKDLIIKRDNESLDINGNIQLIQMRFQMRFERVKISRYNVIKYTFVVIYCAYTCLFFLLFGVYGFGFLRVRPASGK